jgi:hypothetical protein
MADLSEFTPGQVISFELNTNVLAAEYKNCVYMGQVNYDLAILVDDVDAIHSNIYSTLPTGTVDDPRGYNYIIVMLPTKEKKVVGIPWIKDPITINESCIFTVKIYDADLNSSEKIKRALNAMGFNDLEITVN